MYSLDQELAFATQKVREQRAVIATLQSDLAAARAELERAKPALIKAWEIFFTRSFSQDPIGRAEARYAREISKDSTEG